MSSSTTPPAPVLSSPLSESPWSKFVRCMTDGQIGRHLVQTRDGVRWDDPAIDAAEMLDMMTDL